MAKLEKVDVVVVGAGASGSVYAAVLAKTGKKVVVLEQGPDWKLSDLVSSDFWGRRIKHAGAPFLLERSEEHTSELQSLTNLVCRLLLEKKKQHSSCTPQTSRATRCTC